MIAQFIAAFDDIVIGRFNKQREERDRIEVRYLYAPKQRIMHDIINENKTITLPAVAVSVGSVSRDENRVFNKIDGFYYTGTDESTQQFSKHIKTPIPVNLNLNVSIISRYQTDVDQILSNFVPFCNPYVVISWLVPKKFGLAVDQEIRSEVLWDGNVNLNYPVELAGNAKARITADTSFTVKGWLFKDTADPAGNIFTIKSNFIAEDYISEYESLSAEPAPVETTMLSGAPFVTDIHYNDVLLTNALVIDKSSTQIESEPAPLITLNGSSFTHLDGLLLSTNKPTSYYTSTGAFSSNFTEVPGLQLSGLNITDFSVISDNSITAYLPLSVLSDIGRVSLVPYNSAGFGTSLNTFISSGEEGNLTSGIPETYIEINES
jgi:hypothetical protein